MTRAFRVLVFRCLWGALSLVAVLTPARAHEVRPAYLEIVQVGADEYRSVWKVPAAGENLRFRLDVVWPAGTAFAAAPVADFEGRAFTQRDRFTIAGGLSGKAIGIDGLAATLTDVLVRVERADGSVQMVRLTPEQPSFVVAASPGRLEVATTYGLLGVEHILLGFDHLLFVLALLILLPGWKRLVAAVTAFTVAHSLTLAAATLGWTTVPIAPVEAVIALSIALVAAEIVRTDAARSAPIRGSTWAIPFAFGLLHGLGFASALAEVGLPDRHLLLALLTFNLGVEAGQLCFIALVLLLARAAASLRRPPPAAWRRAAAYGIGTLAMFWMVQRVAAF